MSLRILRFAVILWIIAGSSTSKAFAQNVPASRDFNAEIEAALRSAKSAAGFEFLGTLNRNCLLPASGGVNTSNDLPRYVRDASSAVAHKVDAGGQ